MFFSYVGNAMLVHKINTKNTGRLRNDYTDNNTVSSLTYGVVLKLFTESTVYVLKNSHYKAMNRLQLLVFVVTVVHTYCSYALTLGDVRNFAMKSVYLLTFTILHHTGNKTQRLGADGAWWDGAVATSH